VTNKKKQNMLRVVTILTMARLPLVMLFFLVAIINIFYPANWLFILAVVSMGSSAITDLLDGYLARKHSVETDFGAHADPLMDKMFYVITLPVLVYITAIDTTPKALSHSILLLVITVLFLARDLWVTFLRSVGSMYNISGCANWTGKVRTALNFPLICAIYYFAAAPEGWNFIPLRLLYIVEIIALIINVYSVFVYTKYYWPQLRKSAEIKNT
jgi:CDP-diacylglycerol--glycerol-3-phosphate 3-phosphatidyltransferase